MISNIRVGIPILGSKGWIAGISFTESLIKAMYSLPENERPQFFLVVSDYNLKTFNLHQSFIPLFNGVIFQGYNLKTARTTINSSFIHCSSQDELFTKIDLFFPVNSLVMPGRPAVPWIPDFQNRYLPDFFSLQECEYRNARFAEIAKQAQLIIFNTQSVEKDFWNFYPNSKAITDVLAPPFFPEDKWYLGNPREVQQKYQLPDSFVLCSNQFWIHKNHSVLFKAIALLRQAGQPVHVVCTGSTNDYRWPDHFANLQQYIRQIGISDIVHILGLIPREDQIQLIRRSLFVIQPSLFEGFSMIVQECQELGKQIVLSDLDVHLEYAYGIYFERTNSHDLCQKILNLLSVVQPGPDLRKESTAKANTATKVKYFAEKFCKFIEKSQRIFHKTT
ncbi:MAG: glycosyl transferase group 1 [Firmicutes bacterium]|nr:glycosyl transferase group 1 [Bacillota bacterium]